MTSGKTSEAPEKIREEKIKLPEHIAECVQQIDALASDAKLTGENKRKLARARLQVALWVCQKEAVPLTRAALAEILGPDTAAVFEHAEEIMVSLPWRSSEDREITREIIKRRYPSVKIPKSGDYDL